MAEILDALRRDGDSSNTIIGIVILVLLTVFVAPDVLPQLISNTIPFLDEGLPCEMVMNAHDRTRHQSLIGRQATNPFTLRAEVLSFPNDGASPLVIRVVLHNRTIGSVPFVFNPNQVVVGDDPNSSGIGLIFNPPIGAAIDANNDGIANTRAVGLTTFANSDVRVLGPLQRCVHRISIPASQLGQIQPGQSQVRAYYRITNSGLAQQVNPNNPIVYVDQGLGVVTGGFVESPSVLIPVAAYANSES